MFWDAKDIKLSTISAYAKKYKIDRKTVYSLINKGKLNRYRGLDNEPMVDLSQRPSGVKKYGDLRKRRIV